MKRSGIILFFALFCLTTSAFGEGSLEFEDWMEYEASFGEVKVVAKSENTITVEEDDPEGESVLIKYYLKADAELEGIEYQVELMAGDEVDMEYYVTAEGKKVIDFISVERDEEEEEVDILLID